MEAMLVFLSEDCGVDGPVQIVCYVHSLKLGAADSFDCGPVDGQQGLDMTAFSEINNHLLDFICCLFIQELLLKSVNVNSSLTCRRSSSVCLRGSLKQETQPF